VNSFNDAQQEQLKEIGAYLRQLRLEKGLRIEQITAKTLIRQVLLEALEEGRYEDLPEPVFVQGFIKRYGDALGLNGTELAKNFAINFFLLDSENKNIDAKQKSNIKSIHIPLAVPYAILLAFASFALFIKLSPQNSAESVAKSKNQSSAAIEKTVTSLQTGASRSSRLFPVEVSIELQDDSWLRVKADGKTAFEGTLNKGERKTWTANKHLTILSQNAGAVLVSANKKEQKPLGNSGRVKQVTFTPESVNSQ
jgi:cytoskeletal protein RodZ